ncbi:hypothetical protein [Streptomyces litchfieldiae]|uniref:Holin n=1 Tax=Streptomyces litchfieldiae TaxID=3075543 RepID=A0ABU2MZF2_9ACTN|nr:hypothetical protein [Streptomyces sp. DSM 44938]MDT0346752.1 hypothetical protein [Streptomyces sp. DSM 44938]
MNDATRRTLRTILQTLLGLAAALPAIIDAAGIPRTAAWAAAALAVAAGVTAVMSLDSVQRLLPSWLRVTPPDEPPTYPLPTPVEEPRDGGTL